MSVAASAPQHTVQEARGSRTLVDISSALALIAADSADSAGRPAWRAGECCAFVAFERAD